MAIPPHSSAIADTSAQPRRQRFYLSAPLNDIRFNLCSVRGYYYTNSPREVKTSRGLFASSLMIKFNYARCAQKLISLFSRIFFVAFYIFIITIFRPTYKLFKRSSTDFIRSSKFTGVSIVRSKIVRTS